MKTLPNIIIFLLTLSVFAQTNFEKGIFITNNDIAVECYIKNLDWKKNPTKIKYKLSEAGEVRTGTIDSIREFEIYGISKFVRAKVNIDISSIYLDKLSEKRDPIFKEEILFLELLVEGKANLYIYKDGNIKRFFYSLDNNDIKQLVFKEYRLRDSDVIGVNNYYRQQLYTELTCKSLDANNFKNLNYGIKDLSNLFEAYNFCESGTSSIINKERNNKKFLNFKLKLGLSHNELDVTGARSNIRNAEFDSKVAFRVGAEFELILPFNNDKWSFVLEPTFQNYKSTSDLGNDETILSAIRFDSDINYNSIELPLGLRHYFFLNDNSKLFVNAFYNLIFVLDSEIKYEDNFTLDINRGRGYALGIGYNHKKMGLELRYAIPRDILNEYNAYNSDYNQIALIFGYQIF